MANSTRKRRVGSVRKLTNGRYLARITVGCKADGRPRTVTKTHDTEQQAEAWLIAKSVELDKRPDMGAGITLRTLWAAYERDRRGKLANSTLDRYQNCMDRHWFAHIGDMDVSLITPQVAQHVIDTIPGRTDAKQCKAALSSALTWAQRNGMLGENPIRSASFAYPGDNIAAWEDEGAFDEDPFGAIERTRNTWGANDVLMAFPLMRGVPLEPVWLAMVGSGARLEEAFALRKCDVRRVAIDGTEVTQLALHHALTTSDGRHRTKNRKSARIVSMLEPMGSRMWEIVQDVSDGGDALCAASVQNYGTRWRGYFAEPPTSKHLNGRTDIYRGCLHDLPYIPLSRMRATHETLMQEAGVLDSINAAMHGHSERVSYLHYQQADSAKASRKASEYLRLIG